MVASSGTISRLRAADVQCYRAADQLTELLIYGMALFSPWAFGSTERWSIWVMNCAGYALGVLLLGKLSLRWGRNWRPARWSERFSHFSGSPRGRFSAARGLTWILAVLTALLLLYCLVSALNARASFDERSLTFVYYDCIAWLPHSLDAAATWFAFWTYLGLAGFFWGLVDWLMGKSSAEVRAGWLRSFREASASSSSSSSFSSSSSIQGRGGERGRGGGPPMPARLRRLLWLLAINGALLGVEAIVQRTANCPKLLFLVKPHIHQTAAEQFGPYAYRSNAAQYFNLLWPVCLGFWWTLNRASLQRGAPVLRRSKIPLPRARGKGHAERTASACCARGRAHSGFVPHHVLLAAPAIIAACPIISSSRAGAIIAAIMAGMAAVLFSTTHWLSHSPPRSPRGSQARTARRIASRPVLACLVGAMALGCVLGWSQLEPRLGALNDGFAAREQMYAAARPMAHDYPLFGTGPGSFETVSQLYPRPNIFWPAQLHNDWLETRITFGRVGSGLLALALLCVVVRWWAPGGIHGGRRFVLLTWLALAGCLLHARFDFPFQIHSTLFLFLLLCGILFVLSRRPGMGR